MYCTNKTMMTRYSIEYHEVEYNDVSHVIHKIAKQYNLDRDDIEVNRVSPSTYSIYAEYVVYFDCDDEEY